VAIQGRPQAGPYPQPNQIKDPEAILDVARSLYDFSDSQLRPLHLKATYQLYDSSGKPTEAGVFEYWWISPKLFRISWSRPSASRTEWQTPSGKIAHLATGDDLGFFELHLRDDLFSPLPSPKSLDPKKIILLRNKLKLGNADLICVSEKPANEPEFIQLSKFTAYPTQCFDETLPVLRLEVDAEGDLVTVYDTISRVQGRFLAREIRHSAGSQKLITASVESVDTISPTDPALIPPANATFNPVGVELDEQSETGNLTKKHVPIYPSMAKMQGIQGVVIIEVTIDKEGKIKNPHVLVSPSPLLSDAGLDAVSQWEYKPLLEDGTPVPVSTIITVIYTLAR
jgi:TonB family protein